jgi:hypothetical protein
MMETLHFIREIVRHREREGGDLDFLGLRTSADDAVDRRRICGRRLVHATGVEPAKSGSESPVPFPPGDARMIEDIQQRIEQDHDVTVRGGVVTSEPCVSNHGYGGPTKKK